MSASARDIVFTRHPGSRGFGWLKESFAMFRKARLAWIVLLMTYYLMLLFADLVPFIGGLAVPLLKPIFAVGFLAAAWTQERGGAPAVRQLFQGFRANVFALCSLGVVFVLGMMIAVGATAAVDGGRLFDLIANPAPQELDQDAVAKRLSDTLSDSRVQLGMLLAALCAIPTLLALWWAPALVVFQDASAFTALGASLRAGLANWQPLLRYVVAVFFFGGLLPTLAGTLIALIVPAPVGRALALALMLPYVLCFVATLHISDYVSYRDVFHSDETLAPLAPSLSRERELPR
jgi:hypothetical protein